MPAAAHAVTGAVILVRGLTQRGVDDYPWPARVAVDRTPADVGLAYRDAPLRTADGLRLAAWCIPGHRPESLILVHGLGSNRAGLRSLAADLHRRGYKLLLPDVRRDGDSEGDLSTLGVKEVHDVRAAFDHLLAQPEVDPRRHYVSCS